MSTIQKLRILGLSILLLTGVTVRNEVKAQPGVSISFQTFYNELSPYGRWVNSPQYGSIWTPYTDPGFQPYSTNGYWEVTEYGNTWVSDYDWGWAPFHYGRWSFDDYNGWFWIPGYEWGPAWVNWRSGGDYYGWAPLGPGMNVNISINIPSFWWVFVPQRYIASRSWYNYCAPRNRVTHIYNRTTIINNYYRNDNRTYAYGPRRDEIERVTRRSVPVRQIDVNQRGRVITDRSYSRNDRYDAPDRSGPVYRSNGRTSPDAQSNRGSREGNDRYSSPGSGRSDNGSVGSSSRDNGRNSPYNGRTGSTDNSGYQRPGVENSRSERSGAYNAPTESRSNRSYEPAQQNNAPRAEQRSEPAPSYNSERSSRSSRSEAGGYSSGRSDNAPAVRSAPSERSSGSRESAPRSESRSDNSGGNSRAERGGRSPR